MCKVYSLYCSDSVIVGDKARCEVHSIPYGLNVWQSVGS